MDIKELQQIDGNYKGRNYKRELIEIPELV